MKFRIVNSKPGRWGEGWKNGDIVDMDMNAARVALEVGEIEVYEDQTYEPEFKCKCGKQCKSKAGLKVHERNCR